MTSSTPYIRISVSCQVDHSYPAIALTGSVSMMILLGAILSIVYAGKSKKECRDDCTRGTLQDVDTVKAQGRLLSATD